MDERMKKRAAVYQLIRLVDECGGEIRVDGDRVRRVFNDQDDIVRMELATGETVLVADQDFATLDGVIREIM
jgi:hypothetical protein